MTFPGSCTVVGLSRQEDGSVKAYIGMRSHGVYVVLEPGPEADELERGWGAGLVVSIPFPNDTQIWMDEGAPGR